MIIKIICSLILAGSLSADHIETYLKMMKEKSQTFGPFGSWKQGEIEVVLDTETIQKIEKQCKLRLMARGVEEKEADSWSRTGVVAEDSYWIWIRDPVIFPSGVYGTYDRLLWRSGLDGVPGVTILPVLGNKKIIVNLNYRHATRSWEIELPRGQRKMGEAPEAAAKRELWEETGYHMEKSILLGSPAHDTGVLVQGAPIFLAEVSYSGDKNRDYSEAISSNPAYTKQELKEGLARGYIELPVNGKMTKVNCRDPFLAFSILCAEARGLL